MQQNTSLIIAAPACREMYKNINEINKQKPNMVVWAVACPLCMQVVPISVVTFIRGYFFSLPLIQKRASCQLQVKELALNTGKLPPKCLLRKSFLFFVLILV